MTVAVYHSYFLYCTGFIVKFLCHSVVSEQYDVSFKYLHIDVHNMYFLYSYVAYSYARECIWLTAGMLSCYGVLVYKESINSIGLTVDIAAWPNLI